MDNGNKNPETFKAGRTTIGGAEITPLDPAKIWPETNQVKAGPDLGAALGAIREASAAPFDFHPARPLGAGGQGEE